MLKYSQKLFVHCPKASTFAGEIKRNDYFKKNLVWI
jgi:hypothetical protein